MTAVRHDGGALAQVARGRCVALCVPPLLQGDAREPFRRGRRLRRIEPIMFYITDRNPDAYEEALALRERFGECALVLVDNGFIGRVKELTRRSAAYRELLDHDLSMGLPRLEPELADAIEDPSISLIGDHEPADLAHGRPRRRDHVRGAHRDPRLAGAGVPRHPSRHPRDRVARPCCRRKSTPFSGTFSGTRSSIAMAR